MFNTCIRFLIVQHLLFLFVNSSVLYQCLRHCMWNNVLNGCCLNWIIVHNFKNNCINIHPFPCTYVAVNFLFQLILYFLCFKFISIITITKNNGKIKMNWDEKLSITSSLTDLCLDKKNYVCKCIKCGNGCCRISENQN